MASSTAMFIGSEGHSQNPHARLVSSIVPRAATRNAALTLENGKEVRWVGTGKLLYESADFDAFIAAAREPRIFAFFQERENFYLLPTDPVRRARLKRWYQLLALRDRSEAFPIRGRLRIYSTSFSTLEDNYKELIDAISNLESQAISDIWTLSEFGEGIDPNL